jgi:hypothetical protein
VVGGHQGGQAGALQYRRSIAPVRMASTAGMRAVRRVTGILRARLGGAAFEEAQAWATSAGNRQAVEYALE